MRLADANLETPEEGSAPEQGAETETTFRHTGSSEGRAVSSVARATEGSTQNPAPAIVAGLTRVPQSARQVMELTPTPVADQHLKIVPGTIVLAVASRSTIEAVIGVMTYPTPDKVDQEPHFVSAIRSFIFNPRVQARVQEWGRRKNTRIWEHQQMIDEYCQNKKHRRSTGGLAESRLVTNKVNNRARFWEGDDKFTCLIAQLILALPYQAHVMICRHAGYPLTWTGKRRPKSMPACSLDLKGDGRNKSGAMTEDDIRRFRAGTLPPLDYGYDGYVGSLPRNWDRVSVGVEPLYDSEDNLLNGSDESDEYD
jgi:hypothetical protein